MPAFLSFFALHGVMMTFLRHYLDVCEQIRNFAALHKESLLTPKTTKKSMMMKKLTLLAFAFSLFLPMTVLSQDGQDEEEYDYKEKTVKIWPRDDDNQYNVTAGAPIVTTSPYSMSEAIYSFGNLQIMKGDKIAKIGYTGYNPGTEIERHVIVWMQNVDMGVSRVRVSDGFVSVDNMTKVFEGDIVIKSGGQPSQWIQLADITLDEPFTYNYGGVKITVLSYGDVSDHDVYFARSNNKYTAMYSTSDQMDHVSDSLQSDGAPQLKYTIATKVEYLTGQVVDQDGNAVCGAEVTLTSCKWEQDEYKGLTDEEGHYKVRVSEGRNTFRPSAKAAGHIPYMDIGRQYAFSADNDFWALQFKDKKMDFTLYNAIDFKVGVAGTIILPVEPDATLGKYYRLDHREDHVLVFEREPAPQANVPYILMAGKDCRVDISEMDLSVKPGVISIENMWFKGSYVSTDLVITTNQGVFFIDHTPESEVGRIGGCRAYFLVDSLYGPFTYVLNETDGIEQLILAPNDKETDCYDLQGRKLPSGVIPRGIYISNGKKLIGP